MESENARRRPKIAASLCVLTVSEIRESPYDVVFVAIYVTIELPPIAHVAHTDANELSDRVKFRGSAADISHRACPGAARMRREQAHSLTHLWDSHGRSGSATDARRRPFLQLAVILVACAGMTGCLGPKAVRYTRMRYNEVVRDTNDEQLLINIVRLRYADSPIFIDLPNITSQFEVAGGGNYLGGYGNQTNAPASLGFGNMSLRDTPTLSYHPREGREIAKALLTPLSADLFIVVNGGANLEQLLLFSVNDINDVPNASRATTLIPRVPDDNALYFRGVRLMASLREREATELVFGTEEQSDDSSDPMPKGVVEGRDLLNAARDGYVYRTQSDGQVTVRKREKSLYLRIRPDYVHSPEMQEIARIFHVTPGLSKYRIKSELSDEANQEHPSALGSDTFYMNLRSVLQVMTFLSKGVCIPEEHVISGVAPMTPGPDGQPFDWTQITAGHFIVHAQKHRPRDSEVAVHYRGFWFFIAPDDVNSRAALAILEIVFALQESGDRKRRPAAHPANRRPVSPAQDIRRSREEPKATLS